MKTIARLKGPEYLRACNKARHAVEKYLKQTKVMDLRKVLPEIPDGCTDEEREKILAEQGKKNISAMLDRALDEEAEETYELLCSLIILDPGEELDGYDIMTTFLEIVTTPKVMDFFTKLVKSALEIMGD